ncbi:helicase-exonuclease AddAB subunit AddB [Litchfieldia salsa]|uniref:ATP-dependent helicase/deoxyribonuclease subunit B n=1 Tax=Litchfieldia salsa TaxID=930152 RepID=A0A1H0UNL3_9BACI|nr:helicase-exonuclease AddAB subunit AddB [Litchfieldia salsa]SDP67558.1 DNA helicase/exodeoxyribonuclease V, subunit B [Litchfieldia salsa]
MTLQFIIGRAGTGKTTACLNQIREKLTQNPVGDPIVYLVPDQMTFQSEYDLINTPGLGGMMRAQVFSFTRLAWRVLQETGGMSRYHLNNVGMNMIIRKIVEQRKQELKVFSKAADKNGFITQLEEMVAEFKRYCVTPELIEDKSYFLDSENQVVLADKLHDLQLIYQELELHLFQKYVDSEDYLRLLAEKIRDSSYLRDADVLIDGFHSYTPIELEVVGELTKYCRTVTIALTVDRCYDEQPPDDLSLFRMTGNTYQSIVNLAKEHMVYLERPIILSETKRFDSAPALKHLEKFYDFRPTVPFNGDTTVTIGQAVNRRAEIEGISRRILKLVREEKYRYRDIAVLVRNASDYHELIQTIFADYNLPFFIDQKRSMLNHPLIEFIRSSLEVLGGNWRYESVFRCVKTDLLYPLDESIDTLREEMDQLENYVLEYGIQGYKWTSKERWGYRKIRALEGEDLPQTDREKEMEDSINRLRSMIVTPLLNLQKRFAKAKTGRELCEALYLYLNELQIPEKMERLRSGAEEEGKLSEAREHDQVWNAVLELMDQFVEVMSEEKVSIKLFTNMLETGMENMQFALVPPAMDQILVASLERSRFSNIKCTFIIGANDGVLPARPNEEGVFSQHDREKLIHSGLKVAPLNREVLLDENFLIYGALTSCSDQLYMSYPLANDEGKSLQASIIIKRLKQILPSINEEFLVNEPSELSPSKQLDYIVNPSVTLSYLTSQLQVWIRAYPIEDLWWDSYNYLMNDDAWNERSKKVLGSLFYRNKTKKLPIETTRELFGESIQGSVSRMETFQGCPFSHFANYGLKLKERQIFKLEAPDIGQLFHAALKHISDTLRHRNIDWRDLTIELCEQLSVEAVELLAPKLQREILLSSNRFYYIKHKLQKVISRASRILSEHAKTSGFSPVGLEIDFGKNGPLPSIPFELNNGFKMELVGRIDRVDKAESSKGLLLRVIDYKSSQKSLNLTEVYYGLALQMITYLDVIISHSKEWIGTSATPAGVLYFHVHDPMINSKSAVITEDTIEDEIFKSFKMKGLLLGDEESVRLMDQGLESGYSKVVSAAIKKDGSFYSNSSIASEEELTYLKKHVRKVFKQIGNNITDGVIDIAPYKMKDKTPCTFCSFKTVCQFDQSIEENEYRVIQNEKKETILEKIRKEAGIYE